MASEGERQTALVEADFLFGLRRSDARNKKVAQALAAAKRGELELRVLSSAVLEVRTVIHSRGIGPSKCEEAMSLMDSSLAEHGVREFLPIEIADVVVAERLRGRHPDLGYFDSLHAAQAGRLGVPILGSEGAYQRIGIPFIDLDRFEPGLGRPGQTPDVDPPEDDG